MGEPDTRTLPPAAPGPGDDSTATEAAAAGIAPRPPLPLPTIPRYTIVRQLGRGGMGVVYEAVNPLGVRVALKLILPERLSPNLLARFKQEARAMMDLAHPNLARIFDYDDSDAGPFFTMRLLPGDTLAERLDRLRADPTAAVRLTIQVADAVAYLHARGLVHRDLKPSNILVDDRGEPHVSDFGLVKDLAAVESDGDGTTPATPAGGASPTLTHAGARLGTEAYMSPEQFAGDHSRIGPPTDVWALGVILHELAWGDRPRFQDHRLQLPADDGGSPVRTGLRPIVTRCLAWDAADRYPTAADVEADLEALLAPPEPRPTRRRFVVAAAAGTLGAGALGAAWWAFGRRKDDGGSEPGPAGPLDEIKQELADRGSVDLLRPDGSWRWSEWLGGSGSWTPDPAGGGVLAATGKGRARLFEVARGLGPEFRLVAELAHVGPRGQVGLYVGRSLQPSNRGPVHCAIALSVIDHGQPSSSWTGPRVRRRVQVRACTTADEDGFKDAGPLYDLPEPGVAGRPVSASLALSVTQVVAAAGGRELWRGTRNQFTLSVRALGTWGGGGLMPTFDPADGVGLFVYHSALAVRSARIERLG